MKNVIIMMVLAINISFADLADDISQLQEDVNSINNNISQMDTDIIENNANITGIKEHTTYDKSIINILHYYNDINNTSYQDIESIEETIYWETTINNAINLLVSKKGGIIFFPTGIYNISSTILIPETAYPITLKGTGPDKYHGFVENVGYQNGGTAISAVHNISPMIGLTNGTRNVTIQDMTILGSQSDYATGEYSAIGISNIQNSPENEGFVQRCRFLNLHFKSLNYGIRFTSCVDASNFENLEFKNVDRCMRLSTVDASTIEHVVATHFSHYVFNIDRSTGLLIRDILANSKQFYYDTSFNPTIFIITSQKGIGNEYALGRAIEINGVHAEYVQCVAIINASNLSFKNIIHCRFSHLKEIIYPAFILARLSSQSLPPENLLFENVVVDWENRPITTSDIYLSDIAEEIPVLNGVDIHNGVTATIPTTCNGLTITNSQVNIDIPSNNKYIVSNKGNINSSSFGVQLSETLTNLTTSKQIDFKKYVRDNSVSKLSVLCYYNGFDSGVFEATIINQGTSSSPNFRMIQTSLIPGDSNVCNIQSFLPQMSSDGVLTLRYSNHYSGNNFYNISILPIISN